MSGSLPFIFGPRGPRFGIRLASISWLRICSVFSSPGGLFSIPLWEHSCGPSGIVFVVRVLDPVAPFLVLPVSILAASARPVSRGGLQKKNPLEQVLVVRGRSRNHIYKHMYKQFSHNNDSVLRLNSFPKPYGPHQNLTRTWRAEQLLLLHVKHQIWKESEAC